VPQQPNHLNVAVSFGFQPSAGPDPIEITVDVKLEQITGCIAGAPRRLGPASWESRVKDRLPHNPVQAPEPRSRNVHQTGWDDGL